MQKLRNIHITFEIGADMPIYEYRCETCQNIFEIITSAGAAADRILCSKCGSDKVSKLISAGSFLRSSGNPLPSAGSPGCSHRGFS